jgi:hypothetical protein
MKKVVIKLFLLASMLLAFNATAAQKSYFYMTYGSITGDDLAVTDVCYGDSDLRKKIKKRLWNDSKSIMVPKNFYLYKNADEDRVYKYRKFTIRDMKRDYNMQIHRFNYCDE